MGQMFGQMFSLMFDRMLGQTSHTDRGHRGGSVGRRFFAWLEALPEVHDQAGPHRVDPAVDRARGVRPDPRVVSDAAPVAVSTAVDREAEASEAAIARLVEVDSEAAIALRGAEASEADDRGLRPIADHGPEQNQRAGQRRDPTHSPMHRAPRAAPDPASVHQPTVASSADHPGSVSPKHRARRTGRRGRRVSVAISWKGARRFENC